MPAKYSPKGTAITIRGRHDTDSICLEVLDEGNGIPLADLGGRSGAPLDFKLLSSIHFILHGGRIYRSGTALLHSFRCGGIADISASPPSPRRVKRMKKSVLALSLAYLITPASTYAQNAYISNLDGNTVSVIDTATNTVVATIPVGSEPFGVAVTSDGSKVYVSNFLAQSVSVIDAATNTVVATVLVGFLPEGVAVTPDGGMVYVANAGQNTVSVIDAATNTVIATIPVGTQPKGVAVTPDGSKVYVANEDGNTQGGNTVSVINTATNTVVATIPVGAEPFNVAVSPDGSKVYVTIDGDNNVSVIDTATDAVVGTPIPVGTNPWGVAFTPDGGKVYVTNRVSNSVSVINTATNTVVATIPLGGPIGPIGVAVTPDSSKVYVAESVTNRVVIIDTATDTVVGSPISVGQNPEVFGIFIRPAPRFAGVSGSPNCQGTSVSALARKFGDLNAAAAALGFSNVRALHDAIRAFCRA
jgi:YVTN family beta-propeller protein